jgi:hypothetical protein
MMMESPSQHLSTVMLMLKTAGSVNLFPSLRPPDVVIPGPDALYTLSPVAKSQKDLPIVLCTLECTSACISEWLLSL